MNELVDRHLELAALQRLSRENIGPKLLGTCTNGRLEKYLKATPVDAIEFRSPRCNLLLATRMKELHEHVQLEGHERSMGPLVFRTLERWAMNAQTLLPESEVIEVLGSPWALFLDALSSYTRFLRDYYVDENSLNRLLIFAHNDVSELTGLFLTQDPTWEFIANLTN